MTEETEGDGTTVAGGRNRGGKRVESGAGSKSWGGEVVRPRRGVPTGGESRREGGRVKTGEGEGAETGAGVEAGRHDGGGGGVSESRRVRGGSRPLRWIGCRSLWLWDLCPDWTSVRGGWDWSRGKVPTGGEGQERCGSVEFWNRGEVHTGA